MVFPYNGYQCPTLTVKTAQQGSGCRGHYGSPYSTLFPAPTPLPDSRYDAWLLKTARLEAPPSRFYYGSVLPHILSKCVRKDSSLAANLQKHHHQEHPYKPE
jgi:hypothetical protein